MRYTFFLSFYFFFVSFSISQSIKDPYPKVKTDSIEHKSFEELKKLFKDLRRPNRDSAKIYAIAILRKAINSENQSEICLGFYNLSDLESDLGNPKKADKLIDQAFKFIHLPEIKDKLSYFYLQKGRNLQTLQDNDLALDYYIKTKEYAKKENRIRNINKADYNILLLKVNLKGGKDALPEIKKFISDKTLAFQKTKDSAYLLSNINAHMVIGKIYTELNNFDAAIDAYDLGIELCESTSFEYLKTFFITGLGNIYSLKATKESSEKALVYLKEADSLTKKYNRKDLFAFVHLHKGRALFYQQKYQEAIKSLKKAEEIDTNPEKAFHFNEIYGLLTKCYFELGDTKNAKLYYIKSQEVYKKTDSLKVDLLIDIYKKYQLIGISDQIENLENILNKTTTKSNLLTIALSVAILSLVILYMFYRRKQKIYQKRFDELMSKNSVLVKDETKQYTKVSIVSDKKANSILNKLANFEAKELFLDSKYTLPVMAKKLGTNSTYLSSIINNYKGKSFSEYITVLRINTIVKKLQEDAKLRSYTVQSIAEEAGFKTGQSFSRSFKKVTGVYPSYFIKNIDNQRFKDG